MAYTFRRPEKGKLIPAEASLTQLSPNESPRAAATSATDLIGI
jgi:hypothetical protein